MNQNLLPYVGRLKKIVTIQVKAIFSSSSNVLKSCQVMKSSLVFFKRFNYTRKKKELLNRRRCRDVQQVFLFVILCTAKKGKKNDWKIQIHSMLLLDTGEKRAKLGRREKSFTQMFFLSSAIVFVGVTKGKEMRGKMVDVLLMLERIFTDVAWKEKLWRWKFWLEHFLHSKELFEL